jgi:hypothetical protein
MFNFCLILGESTRLAGMLIGVEIDCERLFREPTSDILFSFLMVVGNWLYDSTFSSTVSSKSRLGSRFATGFFAGPLKEWLISRCSSY